MMSESATRTANAQIGVIFLSPGETRNFVMWDVCGRFVPLLLERLNRQLGSIQVQNVGRGRQQR